MASNSFWYIYATNGADGFLLDLIKRPQEAVARLAVYSQDRPPRVLREVRKLDELTSSDGSLNVSLGDFTLGPNGCKGSVGGVTLDLLSTLGDRKVTFLPRWVHKLFSHIPYFSSHYGSLLEGRCQEASYRNLPLVYSTYEVGNIERSRWFIISANQFKDTDLAFEISGSRVLGLWGISAYVYFQGKEYKLTSALASLFIFRARQTGEVVGGERLFDVSIRSPQIRMDVKAKAPATDFAMLEQEGESRIHTTLFGSCEVELTLRGSNADGKTSAFKADRTCLLEVKSGL